MSDRKEHFYDGTFQGFIDVPRFYKCFVSIDSKGKCSLWVSTHVERVSNMQIDRQKNILTQMFPSNNNQECFLFRINHFRHFT
jgi:hypothetical protein